LYRGAKVIVVRAKWFIRGSGLTKQQAPGAKLHTAVDSFGLVLWWSQQQVFLNVKRANRFSLSVYQMGQRVPRLYLIWVDRADSGDRFLKSVMYSLGWIIQVVLPPQQIQSFVLRKKRSVVEQSFSWLN
jgi:transposase